MIENKQNLLTMIEKQVKLSVHIVIYLMLSLKKEIKSHETILESIQNCFSNCPKIPLRSIFPHNFQLLLLFMLWLN